MAGVHLHTADLHANQRALERRTRAEIEYLAPIAEPLRMMGLRRFVAEIVNAFIASGDKQVDLKKAATNFTLLIPLMLSRCRAQKMDVKYR